MCLPSALRASSDCDSSSIASPRVSGSEEDAALSAPLLGRQVEVRLHRLRKLVALLDPLEAGVEERSERQIGDFIADPGTGSRPASPAPTRACRPMRISAERFRCDHAG